MGSKAKIAKQILQVILEHTDSDNTVFVDLFTGGAIYYNLFLKTLK